MVEAAQPFGDPEAAASRLAGVVSRLELFLVRYRVWSFWMAEQRLRTGFWSRPRVSLVCRWLPPRISVGAVAECFPFRRKCNYWD